MAISGNTPTLTLAELNRLSKPDFTQKLGEIFEHAPWVAEGAYESRPFASILSLHQAMTAVIIAAPHAVKLGLIRNHPELAGKAALAGELTTASTNEQKGAGLDHCSPQEYAELTALNRAYTEKFAMPFVIAVRGLTRVDIIAAVRRRIDNNPAEEESEALSQIYRIGRFRLEALIE